MSIKHYLLLGIMITIVLIWVTPTIIIYYIGCYTVGNRIVPWLLKIINNYFE